MSFLTDVATKIATEAVEAVAEQAVKSIADAMSDEDDDISKVAELGGKHD